MLSMISDIGMFIIRRKSIEKKQRSKKIKTLEPSQLITSEVNHTVNKQVDEKTYEEAEKELVKEELIKQEKHQQKVEEILDRGNNILLKISAVWPFDFFPNEVVVDENKVNIICREFFFSEDIHSISVFNIKDISLETNIFFATLKLVPDGYPGEPLIVKFLKKGEAIRLRKIIQGLIETSKKGVDITKLPTDNPTSLIEQLGKADRYNTL